MSFKTSKISYLSFTFKLNEKKVPLKKIWFGDRGLQKNVLLEGGCKMYEGVLEMFQERESLTKKGWRKFKGRGCKPT